MEERYALEHVETYRAYPFFRIEEEQKEDRVYGKIYLEETTLFGNDEGGSLRVSISLVNETMLQREYDEIDRENIASLFFYEFEGETTLKGKRVYTKRMMLKTLDSEKFYAIKMIDIDARDGDIGWIEQQYEKNWIFIGEVLFSASPILTHKVAIVVEEELNKDDDIAKKLQKTYDVWDDNIRKNCIYDKNQILNELKTLFDDCVISKEVSIYNVGQANCCYCDLDTKKIFFDIGVTRSGEDRKMPLIQSAVKEISALDVDAVVLSHWDLDHILSVCYNSKCLQEKIWIVSDFEKMYDKPRVSMKRLCNYLLKVGNSRLLMVDTTDSNKVLFQSVNDAVTIYLGDPVCSEKINKMNNGGLLMKLQNNKNILMPGDCENKIISKEAVCNPYDYVVIPHHGSYMSTPRFFGKKNKKNTAYLCCGEHPGHCSYNNNIKKVYRGKRFSCVRNTKDLKKHNKYKIIL